MAPETSDGRSVASRQAVQAALSEELAAEPGVVAAYLFGSVARGTAGPLSDIDVALLLADPREDGSVCDRTMDTLCRRFRTSRVDVVSLASAPMPLRYRVVRDGALVLCRDAAILERFITEAVLQYLDFKPLRDRAFGRMREIGRAHV